MREGGEKGRGKKERERERVRKGEGGGEGREVERGWGVEGGSGRGRGGEGGRYKILTELFINCCITLTSVVSPPQFISFIIFIHFFSDYIYQFMVNVIIILSIIVIFIDIIHDLVILTPQSSSQISLPSSRCGLSRRRRGKLAAIQEGRKQGTAATAGAAVLVPAPHTLLRVWSAD